MIFRKFKVWWGKFLYEKSFPLSIIAILLTLLPLTVFMFGHIFVDLSDLAQIILLFVCFSSFCLCGYIMSWSFSSKNPGLAVDKTKELVQKNIKFIKEPSALIKETEKTGDPTKLNKWRENKEKVIEAKKNMRKLKFRKNAIQNGKALEQINVKIARKKERIDKLNSKKEV